MIKLTIKRKMLLLMGIMVTVIPTTLVGVLAYAYYLLGVENFFSVKVNAAVANTVKIAQLYLEEHKENVKIDALSAAANIEKNKLLFLQDPELLQVFIDQYANARGLPEVMVFNQNEVIVRNLLGFSLFFETIKPEVFEQLAENEVIILADKVENRVRAVAKVSNFFADTYVLVGRYIDQEILNHISQTKDSAAEYKILVGDLELTKTKLEKILLASSVFFLIISILIARKFAIYIARPLEQLSEATVQLKNGDFSVRVQEGLNDDELSSLAKAFNVMIERIAQQRSELISANELIDERRRFIEVVWAEIFAGGIVVDMHYNITLYNNTAANILAIQPNTNKLDIRIIFPEVIESLEYSMQNAVESQINHAVIQRNGHDIHIHARIGPVANAIGKVESIVITFNDITDLIASQKSAAWADLAKRVAHEIKNPLTPIILAAERLKRKYGHEISSDPESFLKYIDTIIRHVNSIESMVTEFIDFARIPTPNIQSHDIYHIIQESLMLQRITHPKIQYVMTEKDHEIAYVECDHNQILRVMNNLLANAADAIEAKLSGSHGGKVVINLQQKEKNNAVVISVIDNGAGIAPHILHNISEPYITTKAKGMGVGLSIVKKIVEDHGGNFMINNIEGGVSASFSLILSTKPNAK